MGGGQGWRINQSAEDVFRSIDKRLGAAERRPSPSSVFDSLGPGMSSRAIQILDWNSEEATFNGYFWSIPGALHSPDPTIQWTGHVIAKDDGSGLQQVWNVDPLGVITWMRTWVPNELGDGNVVFTDWKRFATSSGLIGFPEIDQPVIDDIQQALDDAAAAFDYAEQANKVFRQDEPPVSTPEYTLRINDTWFDTNDGNAIYLWNGSAWVSADNGLLTDLGIAVQQAQADATQALSDADAALGAAQAANKVFRQGTAPTSGGGYTLRVNDVWFNTAAGNEMKVWSGSAWVSVDNALLAEIDAAATAAQADATQALADADAALDAAVSANKVFRQGTAPVSDASYTLRVQDTWFNTANGNEIKTWNGTAWTALALGSPVIAADAITNTHVADNAISTPQLDANAITAKHTLTGPTIQTEATAARGIKINSTGLIGYDATGATKFLLTTAGALTMTGPITTGGEINGAIVTGGTMQTEATAARGIKMTSSALVGYDAAGVATFSLTASTGALALKGTLQSGSNIAGATLTGVLQTDAAANTGIKISTSSLIAYGGGTAKTTINAATGLISTTGAITTGGSIDGAIVTGGTIQTETTTARGIKMTSSALLAYNASGTPTFSVTASTGAVALLGELQSGSSISGATLTGILQTSAAANTGVKISNSGIYVYSSSNQLVMSALNTGSGYFAGSLATGSYIDSPIVTGGTLQTESTVQRGIKINSSGFTAYDAAGNATVTISTAGVAQFKGTITSGSTITGASIVGTTSITGATISGGTLAINGASGFVVDSVGAVTMGNNFTMNSGYLEVVNNDIIGGRKVIANGGLVATGTGLVAAGMFYGGIEATNAGPSGYGLKSAGGFDLNGGGNISGGVTINGGITMGTTKTIAGGPQLTGGGSWGGGPILSGGVEIQGNVTFPSLAGTGNRAVYSTSAGVLTNSSSSMRYKENDRALRLDAAERLYDLTPIVWQYRDRATHGDRLYAGFSAEQTHQMGLSLYVDYDVDGRPDNVRTADLVAPMLLLIQQQERRIRALEAAR